MQDPDAAGVAEAPSSRNDEPWRRDAAEVAAELGTDVRTGLTPEEAADRLARVGDWLVCVALASLVLWADEAKKLLQRHLRA